MDIKIFRLLQQVDWDNVGRRLMYFALHRFQHYGWAVGIDTSLPKGRTIEDVVHEVITKTISGQRKWDPDKGPLEPWLKYQIKSEIDALVNSAVARREMKVPVGEEGEELWDLVEMAAVEDGIMGEVTTSNPEHEVIQKEKSQWAEKRVSELIDAVDGEPELEAVMDAILSGCEPKPRFLAEELGVPVKDINNRQKRLRRRALSIRMQNE